MSLLDKLRLDIADDVAASGATVPGDGLLGKLRLDVADDGSLFAPVAGGSPSVSGPGFSTDNAITRWDGVTGDMIQNSLAILDDTGTITTPGGATLGGDFAFGGSQTWSTTPITGPGDYASTASDAVILMNKTVGAPTIVTLPPAPAAGRVMVIKDMKGDAFTNNITVVAAVGTIDGLASFVMTQNYQSLTLLYNGTEWNVV